MNKIIANLLKDIAPLVASVDVAITPTRQGVRQILVVVYYGEPQAARLIVLQEGQTIQIQSDGPTTPDTASRTFAGLLKANVCYVCEKSKRALWTAITGKPHPHPHDL